MVPIWRDGHEHVWVGSAASGVATWPGQKLLCLLLEPGTLAQV